MTMEVIQHIELGSAQASIEFTSINSGYTDLMVQMSLRSAQSDIALEVFVAFNGSTSGFSARQLFGSGSSVGSSTPARQIGLLPGATSTSNVFSNATLYIPNYRSSVAKSYSVDSVTENNATTAYQNIVAGLWTGTDPITSLTISNTGGNNFVAGSSATLYGIKSAGTGAKATGGTIYYDAANSKYVHVFTASGTFTPTQNLTGVEYLVIAGGGAGGNQVGGGGGAGGYRSSVVGELTGGGGSPEATLSLTASTNYTVTIGAGGAITGTTGGNGGSGSNSVFGSITATGGGGGGGYNGGAGSAGLTGGSGGGGGGRASSGTTSGGTAASPTQGFNGGTGIGNGSNGYAGGGGGGAGAVGVNASAGVGAAGGAGLTSGITGTSSAYAGGGGGASDTVSGAGGSGGGGAGGINPSTAAGNGQSNRGAGGGGQRDTAGAGNGGSGIVIVRYSA